MIIYNKEWLNNLHIIEHLQNDFEDGSVTKEELNAIKASHPVGFYQPGIVMRVGLFIITVIVLTLSAALLSLMASGMQIADSPGWLLFLGALCYFITETFIRGHNHYHSGIDNAALYFAAGLLSSGGVWILSDAHLTIGEELLPCVFVCLLCLYLTLRFSDLLVCAAACIAAFASVYFFWGMFGKFGLATMPFIMMVASGGTYVVFSKLIIEKKHLYYANCIATVKLLSLITLYSSGNYFVVNTLNNMLNGLSDSHTYVPVGFIFWAWTMLVPIVYVYFGLRKKNVMLLRLGMLLIAATVATVRVYYHLLPIEVMLTLSGAIILAATYVIISYLKMPRNGIIYAEPERANLADKLNIEGLIIGESTSHIPAGPQAPSSPFGGGTGGGGGSSSSF